ncbi:MAG: KEOPS complex subunit Pcc1 [Thermoplasmata archaeon]
MFNFIIKIKSDNPEKILRSVEIENRGYVDSHIEGNYLIFEIKSKNFKSFYRTVDDLLNALSISVNLIEE